MVRLQWDSTLDRTFQMGVDRGVFYPAVGPGVPWVGLISVEQRLSTDGAQSYFVDGIRHHVDIKYDEYEGSVEAYTYPDNRPELDGLVEFTNGLMMPRRSRKTFGLCYRNRIANNEDGDGYGYILNLVYNLKAEFANVSFETLTDDVNPTPFVWDLFATPDTSGGFTPTSYIQIDSRKTPTALMLIVEDIVYGSDTNDPRLPSPEELRFIFSSFGVDIYDGGELIEAYYALIDGGFLSEIYDKTIETPALVAEFLVYNGESQLVEAAVYLDLGDENAIPTSTVDAGGP